MPELEISFKLRARHAALLDQRTKLGFTQQQLAVLCTINIRDVIAFECLRFAEIPNVEAKALKIAKALELPVDSVLPPGAERISVPQNVEKRARVELRELARRRTQELPDLTFQREEGRDLVRQALQHLTFEQRRVIEERYGIGDKPPKTLDEVGAELGLSRERIRQIEAKAIRRLQTASMIPERAISRAGECFDVDVEAAQARYSAEEFEQRLLRDIRFWETKIKDSRTYHTVFGVLQQDCTAWRIELDKAKAKLATLRERWAKRDGQPESVEDEPIDDEFDNGLNE